MPRRLVSSRPVSLGRDGMVASPHYLASLAGVRILLSGGNAIDAAIAVSSVLTVVYPHNTTIGGDAFALVYSSKNGELKGINASGRSAYAADLSYFRDAGLEHIPLYGMLPVTVPGLVDGWSTMLEKYGTKPLADILQQAIDYARNGFPVSKKLSFHIKEKTQLLSQVPSTRSLFLPDGRAPEPSEIFTQRNLSNALELIAREGCSEFYKGKIARSILEFSRKNGGLLSEKDFAEHKTTIVDPVSVDYRGNKVVAFPPNSQGITTLIALNILEQFDLSGLGQSSASLIDLIVEAKKMAFKDRDGYITDPETSKIPVEQLLSKVHSLENKEKIKNDHRKIGSISDLRNSGDTCYFSVVDRFGNVVSFIQSVYFGFGSGLVAGDTGILLQNRGAYFSLEPSHPNVIAPHKRTMHTLAPAMMFRGDIPALVFGTMGGDGQPQTQLQLITDIVDFGMDVQEAIESPRWLHGRAMIGDVPDALNMEEGFSEETCSGLKEMGHRVVIRERWDEIFGHAQAIMIDPKTRVLSGGADPRGDGLAIGY
ncbi:MAG: gamma-glutamyltransferase [Nitrososphaerales archaeon]